MKCATLSSIWLLAFGWLNAPALAAEVDFQDILILKQTAESQQQAIDQHRTRLVELESRLAEVRRELENLKRSTSTLAKDYATIDQLKALANKLEQIDRNRVEDNRRILDTLKRVADAPPVPAPVLAPLPHVNPRSERAEKPPGLGPTERLPNTAETAKPSGKPPLELPEFNYEHVVQTNQTLSEILSAYRREKGLKTTMAHLEAANPGLNPRKLRVGKVIKIPAVK